MGLTVHYRLHSDCPSPSAAKRQVVRLRSRALDLPFDEVGPIEDVETKRNQSPWDEDPPFLWLDAIQSCSRGRFDHDVLPRQGFAFAVHPGPGCETASFGLCVYPKSITLENGRRARTGLTGWSWRTFCKTQYASNPRYGGFENFRRCHVSLIEFLDAAAELGFQTQIKDESHYATHRNLTLLRQETGEWNELVAGVVGRLKDSVPGEAEAPIIAFPNFEHLEARGRSTAR